MIRRLFRQIGTITVLSFLWKHRGSVVRGIDLAKRTPTLVRDGRTRDLAAEARAVVALDGPLATETGVRISGIEDGSVLLRGDPAGPELQSARTTLLTEVPNVVDVRTDAAGQPTLDTMLGDARV
jgi:hypothetical protein